MFITTQERQSADSFQGSLPMRFMPVPALGLAAFILAGCAANPMRQYDSELRETVGLVRQGSVKQALSLVDKNNEGNALSKEARQRLKLMCESSNGFEIAEADMRLRGPGDLEGTAQSGLAFDLHIASLAKDGQILEWARSEAQKILDDDPLLASEKNKMLRLQLEILGKRRADYSKIS